MQSLIICFVFLILKADHFQIAKQYFLYVLLKTWSFCFGSSLQSRLDCNGFSRRGCNSPLFRGKHGSSRELLQSQVDEAVQRRWSVGSCRGLASWTPGRQTCEVGSGRTDVSPSNKCTKIWWGTLQLWNVPRLELHAGQKHIFNS